MKIYPHLKPISATSTMVISNLGKFSQSINYFYADQKYKNSQDNYRHFSTNQDNKINEIELFTHNMQDILDSEKNYVNDNLVNPKVLHCSIFFLNSEIVQINWIIEFSGQFKLGENVYVSYIEPADLEYPIFSTYIFDSRLRVENVTTSLSHQIDINRRIIEYWGKVGDYMQDYEQIIFKKLK